MAYTHIPQPPIAPTKPQRVFVPPHPKPSPWNPHTQLPSSLPEDKHPSKSIVTVEPQPRSAKCNLQTISSHLIASHRISSQQSFSCAYQVTLPRLIHPRNTPQNLPWAKIFTSLPIPSHPPISKFKHTRRSPIFKYQPSHHTTPSNTSSTHPSLPRPSRKISFNQQPRYTPLSNKFKVSNGKLGDTCNMCMGFDGGLVASS